MDRIRYDLGVVILILVPGAAVLADPRLVSLVDKVGDGSKLPHRAPSVGCARCAALPRAWAAFERQFRNELEPADRTQTVRSSHRTRECAVGYR